MNSKSSAATFFIEIMVSILFFAVCSVVIIQMFVISQNRSVQSSDMTYAIIQAKSILEQVKNSDGKDFSEQFDNINKITDSEYEIPLKNNEGEMVEKSFTANMKLSETPEQNGKNSQYVVTIKKNSNEIFALETSKYTPNFKE